MYKRILSMALAIIMTMSVFCGLTLNASAATSGDNNWEYTVTKGEAAIVCYYGNDGDVVIPDILDDFPVTSIESGAFAWNASFTNVTIARSIKSISDEAFMWCQLFDGFTVDENNPYYSSEDGVLFNKDKSILVRYPEGKKGVYSVPDNTQTIGNNAFFNCASLTGVTIPGSVTVIGDSAFYYCTSLASITIPNSVKTIGDYMFYGCEALTSVTLRGGITSIGDYTFTGCDSLKSIIIPNGVKTIGIQAFSDCVSLSAVTIPDSVTKISDYAFYYCKSLKSVSIPSSVTGIGSYAFTGCAALSSISISKNVKSIGIHAFLDCNSLKSITVDASNTGYSSASGVLFNKNKTKLIQYPKGKAGAYTIPSSVTTIGEYAFYNCASLTGVTIPSSVKTIETTAFFGCTSLKSVTIPKNVKSIGDWAFYNCHKSFTISCYYASEAHYYAEYEEMPYKLLDVFTVTYKDSSKTLDSTSILSGSKASSYKPTKKGYAFIGWYTSTKYTTKFDFSKAITKSTSIYARFFKIPSAPGSFAVKKVKSGQIKVSWKKQSGYNYIVEMSTTGKSGSFSQISNTTNGSYTKKNLKKGKTYYFKVYTFKKIDGVKVKSSYTSVKKTKA